MLANAVDLASSLEATRGLISELCKEGEHVYEHLKHNILYL